MRCKKAEKLLSRSWDDRLSSEEKGELERHLAECSSCHALEKEYRSFMLTLRDDTFPEPQPYFWERLEPRLKESRPFAPWALWKQWGLRVIPLSLAVILFFTLTATFLLPPAQEEINLSGTESLMQDQIPFQDLSPLLAGEELDNPNMELIFMASDETRDIRRKIP
jgi:anti-sigma factor RsiW